MSKIAVDFIEKDTNNKAKLRVLTICNTGKLATPGDGNYYNYIF